MREIFTERRLEQKRGVNKEERKMKYAQKLREQEKDT